VLSHPPTSSLAVCTEGGPDPPRWCPMTLAPEIVCLICQKGRARNGKGANTYCDAHIPEGILALAGVTSKANGRGSKARLLPRR